jgi:succinate-acetate transporter protein
VCNRQEKKKTIKEEAHASSQGTPFLLLSFVFASFLISLHAQELASTKVTIVIKAMPPSSSLLKFKVLVK